MPLLTDGTLDFAAFVVSLFFLSYSAYSDLRIREVSDRVWMAYLPVALVVLFFRIILIPHMLVVPIVSVLVTTSLSFLASYLGLFGGADAKALICLGVTFPTYPQFVKPLLTISNPLFPLAVLYNGYLFSLSTVFYVVMKNLSWKYKTGRSLFENHEDAALFTKIATFVTGYRTDFRTLKEKVYLYPMEEVSRSNDGSSRILRLFTHADIERGDLLRDLAEHLKDGEEVWVTPGIPLLVFLLMGLISTVFIGDILIWMVVQGVSMISG